MGGTNSREEYPYEYAHKGQWVVQHQDDDRDCCMAVATSHFFRPAIGHDGRRSRHGNPQDAHDVNAWDAYSEPGTPVAPLRSSYNGWHKGGASGARYVPGSVLHLESGAATRPSGPTKTAPVGPRTTVLLA